ncbi:tropinone reductase-like 2 [Morus notabilis]|uniref:tropinone reductase-like 2 n=1 Tax=Morus notabilis TaxID=981085 RepID=UPI000CED012B|nr:tropinone reductase-like 2 [Morus notabilis]
MSRFSSSSTPYKRLEGKVAIITGGASGIGASTARLFHANGAKVIIADIQDELGRSTAEKLGENAYFVHCDVSKEDDVRDLVDAAVARHGKLDIMYNNAGVLDKPLAGILESTKSDLDKVVSVNVVGAFLGAKHAARVMIPRRKGCILFTASACTSIAGLSSHPYTASKYAIWGLARNLAAEVGEFGVRVNCVSPYAVLSTGMTPISGGAAEVAQMEEMVSEIGNLKGHILKAEDVAMAALFLASDEAHYVSGLNLLVDGGFSVVNPSLPRPSL